MGKNKFENLEVVRVRGRKYYQIITKFYYSKYKKSYLYKLDDGFYYYEKWLNKLTKEEVDAWVEEKMQHSEEKFYLLDNDKWVEKFQ